LEPHPDIGLDVFHVVTDMECAIGVGKGGCNEQFARRWITHKAVLAINKVIKT
jgi:hypothetical protein